MLEWKDIKIYKYLKDKDSEFIPNIDKMISYCGNTLKYVSNVFDNYTNHDIDHSKMVIKYMSDLINDIVELSDLELTIIIYSGLLHDIGMVVTKDEIELVKSDKYNLTDYKYECVFDKVKDEKLSIQEIIRPIHGERSKRKILDNVQKSDEFRNLFCIPNFTNIMFYEEVADICLSHNKNFGWLEENLETDIIKGKYRLNSRFIAILLRLGDLLDIDEQRTPLYLYKLLSPKGISDLEWKQHFIIENTEKVVYDSNSKTKKILLCGVSTEPVIHRKILRYIDYINTELGNSTVACENFEKQYNLNLKSLVDNRIVTKGFSFSDCKLSLDYVAVTNLLMGENIYGSKLYGLRELIQNSIDACKLMIEESSKLPQYKWQKYKPYIRIEIDKDRNKVIIADNGIGMSLEIIKKYFLNVGISYYSSNEFKFKGYNFKPIGNYGIGFLACFMLSSNVEINTKRYNENISNIVSIEKESEYICLTQKNDYRLHGTDIILNYDEFIKVFPNINAVKNLIERTFLNNEIPIILSECIDGESRTIQCALTEIIEQTDNIIRIDNYLKDISGYLDLRYKNILFIESLSEVLEDPEWDLCYIYDTGKLQEENELDDFNIVDLIEDDCLYYISIPIITNETYDEFMKNYDVLEDYDEALERMGAYRKLNIFITKEYIDDIFNYDIEQSIDEFGEDGSSKIVKGYEDIIDGINKEYLVRNFNHDRDVPLLIRLHRQLIIGNNSGEFLCFKKDLQFNSYYSSRQCKVFNKGILLQSCNLTIPYWIEGMFSKEIVLNIDNKDIIPNVARNNIPEDIKDEMSYSIGRAICLWMYNNAKYDINKKNLLEGFIDKYYGKDNLFSR